MKYVSNHIVKLSTVGAVFLLLGSMNTAIAAPKTGTVYFTCPEAETLTKDGRCFTDPNAPNKVFCIWKGYLTGSDGSKVLMTGQKFGPTKRPNVFNFVMVQQSKKMGGGTIVFCSYLTEHNAYYMWTKPLTGKDCKTKRYNNCYAYGNPSRCKLKCHPTTLSN